MNLMYSHPVRVLSDADGNAVGVMVDVLGARIALDLHTVDCGMMFTWPDAMKRLEELGKEGYTEMQGRIIGICNGLVDAAIREAGGEPLGWEWTVSPYNRYYAWMYNPSRGKLNYSNKYDTFKVRPLLSSEEIDTN